MGLADLLRIAAFRFDEVEDVESHVVSSNRVKSEQEFDESVGWVSRLCRVLVQVGIKGVEFAQAIYSDTA